MSRKTGDFEDFSLDDDDLYKDFLRMEQGDHLDDEKPDSGTDGKRKENLLLGGDKKKSSRDELSELEEEITKNKKTHSHGDIQSLMSVMKKEKDYNITDDAVNEDMLESFRRQKATNKHTASYLSDMPSDINLLDDPVDEIPDSSNYEPGDEGFFQVSKYLSIGLSLLAVVLLSVSIYINVNPEEEIEAKPPESMQGTGDIINNAISDGNHTATVTQTPGQDSGSTSSSEGLAEEDVRYEIVSDGGINTASISYINASGSRESDTGVTLPWSKVVTNASSITPHIAANPGERGTLTCKIYKGSEKIAEDTAAGENASVECKG